MAEALDGALRFDPPAKGVWLPGLWGLPLAPRTFDSIYFDTPTWALARGGLTLHRRVENGSNAWRLNICAQPVHREFEVTGGGLPPADVRVLLRAHRTSGELVPVAELRTTRTGIRVLDGERALADVLLDEVDGIDRLREATSFRELEVEVVDGDAADLALIAKRLRQSGAVPASLRPTLFRVVRFDPEGRPPRVAPAIDHVRALVRRQVGALYRHDVGLRLGGDIEDLHDFRVATRRLRAILRVARRLLGVERVGPVRAELEWLAAKLGPARDLDVMLEQLDHELRSLSDRDVPAARRLVGAFEAQRAMAGSTVDTVLNDARYFELVSTLDQLGHENGRAEEEAELGGLARAEFRRLAKGFDGLSEDSSDDELHAKRILAKRARYAAELAAPVVGSRAERFVKEVKALQDVVGKHQDAAVLEERLRASAGAADFAFVAGLLAERQRQRRRAARAELWTIWPRVRRAGERAWSRPRP